MKILIADDNAVVRMGLTAILARVPDIDTVIEAENGREAVELAEAEQPDVVLLDVRMPHLDGIGVLQEIAHTFPTLMLTHSQEADIVRLALQHGAKGYLVHGEVSPEEIVAAIRTCQAGGMVLSAPAVAVMAGMEPGADTAQSTKHHLEDLLTKGEFAVLQAAAEGAENEEIARDLFLSARTVKNYLNSAYAKIGVHSRAAAVAAWHAES